MNCREISVKNQYYKKIEDESEHNYRLLIHRLQPGSLLLSNYKTIIELLKEKIIESTPSSSDQSSFEIYKKILNKIGKETIMKYLSSDRSPVNLFIPTDKAFQNSLRQDQINSLVEDKKCSLAFLHHNTIYDEICPHQIVKYNTEYYSQSQHASLVVSSDSTSNQLLFNGQIVNLTNPNTASNGMIYKLSTVRLTGVVEFLYELVINFKKDFNNKFISSLKPTWLNIIRNNSIDSTLFIPFEVKYKTVKDNQNYTDKAKSINHLYSSNISTDISDYLIQSKYTLYQLNNGDILTSYSNKKYLINVFKLKNDIPDFMSFIPSRNFQRKSINCQQLVSPDLSACGSQLIVYKSESGFIPPLSNMSILEYISTDDELNVFSNLLDFCGNDCKNKYKELEIRGSAGHIVGYTLLLPTNEYFSKSLNNFNKLSRNLPSFLKDIQSNIFHGTNCYFYLQMDVVVRNLLKRQVSSRRLINRIVKPQSYLAHNGILVHKTNQF